MNKACMKYTVDILQVYLELRNVIGLTSKVTGIVVVVEREGGF